MALTACTDHDWVEGGEANAGDMIQIGGISTSPLDITVSENATRALNIKDAEKIRWLIRPLKQGLDITYGKVSTESEKRNERVAILKLKGGTLDDEDYEKDNVTNWAVYSFNYKSDGKPAIWYDNGEHYFEGLFVPGELRYGAGVEDDNRTTVDKVNSSSAPDITTNQSKVNNNLANYTLLEHYLAMPANTQIHATVGRVKLPFYHRLSRVIAYILIDPEMNLPGADPVTLKGYKLQADGKTPLLYTYDEYIKLDGKGNVTQTEFEALTNAAKMKEDPATTSLRFCNVDVLAGVKDTKSATTGTHELTPNWITPRKVIPHFVEEEGSEVYENQAFVEKDADFLMYYDDGKQEYIFPTMDSWPDYHTKYGKGDTEALKTLLKNDKVTITNYGKVPVYDLIVRPTYTAENNIMYDERNSSGGELTSAEKSALVTKKNKIDFELTLSNGLIYTKEFEFDLDANKQTVVYLRISRESVDYNASGSDVWINKQNEDDYYGVDNTGGHSLSLAGSSWQRAYTFGSTVDSGTGGITSPSTDKVTDGGFYNEKTEGEDGTVGQYVTAATWIQKFAQAYEDGACHGDYFILTDNITLDAKLLPDNFVFTGHLDARGHTITVTGTGVNWYEATTDYTILPLYSNQTGTLFVMPTLYTQTYHPANYNNDSELYKIGDDWYLISTLTEKSHEATEEDVTNGKAENVGDKVIDGYETNGSSVKKQEAYYTYHEATGLTVSTMMTSDITYYERSGDAEPYTYTEYRKPTVLYKKHTSGTSLFAGLNGAYSATNGQANVHLEGGVLVPYTDGTTGWRAEVMNVKVNGLLFPEEVYTQKEAKDGEGNTILVRSGYITTPSRPVSGNVENCYDGTGMTKVPNHTPALFKY